MKIAISGALGHIGSKLIRTLGIPCLDKVYLIDNMLTQRYSALFDLPDNVPYVFKDIDFAAEEIIDVLADCDVLIHLAAITNAEASFEKQEEVEEVNKIGVSKIAHICAEVGCSMLFPSSTSVYGSQSALVDENCPESELVPQSPYAESKIFGEKLMQELGRTKSLNYTILRIGTIFGCSPGMRFHTAVNKFCWQAAKGDSISVWETALDQKRPYCGINDICNAISFIVQEREFNNGLYNIVTKNYTVRNIVDIIKTYVPGLEISLVDSKIMNQLSYEVSNQKSLDLGITYTDDADKAIAETIAKLKNINTGVAKKAGASI